MKHLLKKFLCMILSAAVIAPTVSAVTAYADDSDDKRQPYILGDVNCDKKISLKDASLVQRAVLSLDQLTDIQYALACVDGSDILSLKDSLIIQRYSLSIIDEYAANSDGKIIGDAVYFDSDSDTDSEIINSETDTDSEIINSESDTDSEIINSESDTDSEIINSESDTDSVIIDTNIDQSDTDTHETDSDDSNTDTEKTGYSATFNCTNTYAIVYYTRDSTEEKLASEEKVFARNGVTGEIDNSGEGEINFSLFNYGMMIVTDIKIEGEYSELITVDEKTFRYRITGIKSDLAITAHGYYGGLKETDTETDNSDTDIHSQGFKAEFNCTDTHPIIYFTRESTEEDQSSDEIIYARNGESGAIDTTGEGEINFSLFNNGSMIYADIKVEGEYSELLTVDHHKFRYRITGVKSDLVITAQGFYTGLVETDTDSAEPYDILPIEDIQYMLDGNFERGTQLGDIWKQGRGTKKGSISIESGSRTDGSKCLKLTTTNESATFAYNNLHGLKPEHTYKLTVKAWGNLTACEEHHNGIYLNVGQLSGLGAPYTDESGKNVSGWGAYFDAYNNWIQTSCDVTTITMYFESTSTGLADVECALWGTGTAYFDDLTIEEVDYDSEPRDKTRVMTENIGLVLMNDTVEGITVEQMQNWCEDVELAYQQMNDLKGVAPYKGDRIYLISVAEPYMTGFQALSGNRVIKWVGGYMGTACVRYCTDGLWSDVAYHEIGHLYDFLEEYQWCFVTSEMGAEFCKLYCLELRGEGKFKNHGWGIELDYDQLYEYTKSMDPVSYDYTIAVREGDLHYVNLNYILTRAVKAVGWETARDTFHGFAHYYDPRYTTNRSKYEYFMMCLQQSYNRTHKDATGFEVIDTFPEGEFDYIGAKMNPTIPQEAMIHKVTFLDPDGNRLWFDFVSDGESANPPEQKASDKYGTFTGWDTDITNVTSDMTVTALYENYKPVGTVSVTTGSDNIYEGELATVKVDVPTIGTYQYNIICINGSETIFESGYTSSNTASFMLKKSGSCTVYAKVKDSDGNEFSTQKTHFTAQRAVVVYYSGYSSPNIHYKVGSGTWTTPPGVKMTSNSDVEGYSFKFVIPLDSGSSSVTCCFNDGNNNWDNNGEKDYKLSEGAVGVKNGTVTQIT